MEMEGATSFPFNPNLNLEWNNLQKSYNSLCKNKHIYASTVIQQIDKNWTEQMNTQMNRRTGKLRN
jgi:hypothetical protein